MNAEICELWSPVSGIEWPAADICFVYEAPYVAIARMRFSNVLGGAAHDLMLHFSDVIAIRHESESVSCIQLPNLPPLNAGKWPTWTYPLVEVRNSLWLAEYNAVDGIENPDRRHFVLISLNDLLHVLAGSSVEASWVEPITSE